MTLLAVDIDDFVQGARILDEDVADRVDVALHRLSSALADTGGMAGDDPAGRAFAEVYEPAARSAFRAMRQVAAAAYATSAMFGRSAVNYARAEAASTTGGSGSATASVAARLPGRPVPVTVPQPPDAAGGGGDEPSGWGLIKHLVGHVWPNGHQDRLRAAAAAYRRCAAALDETELAPLLAGIPFARDRLPEADDVLTVCQGLRDRIRELASVHRSLGGACADLADRIDECHAEVRSELLELGVETGIVQSLGAGASVFTFGLAEVPTQSVQAARVAAVAARVGELISSFGAAVRGLVGAVPGLAATSERIAATLAGLNGARLVHAGVTDVARLSETGRVAMVGREGAATSRIARTSRAVLQTPKRLIGRKPGDPGVWGDHTTLADHFERHGRGVGARTEEEYVSKSSDLLQRGLRGELPTKIDGRGNIRVYNERTREFGSFRPDGSTRTYFRPKRLDYFDDQRGVLQ